MKRFRNVTADRFDAVMAEATAYADEHRDEQVEIYLVGERFSLTGSMPMLQPNVTIIGPEG